MNPIGGCVRFRAIHRHAEAHCGKWGKTDENWSYPYFYYEYLHFSEENTIISTKINFVDFEKEYPPENQLPHVSHP